VILFLDSDDTLLPTAVERAVECFREPDVAKAHWALWEMGEHGGRTGALIPRDPLPHGDLRETMIEKGPHGLNNPPTSGNAWSRRFLEKVLPVPEREYVISADAFLFTLAPIFGRVARVPEPQSCYRVHGANNYWRKTFAEKMEQNLRLYDNRCEMLSRHLRDQGIHVDPETWKARDGYYAWMVRLRRATEDLAERIAPGETFILIDEAQWGGQIFADRTNLPFTERDGQYWGPPADDEAAVAEFERLRGQWKPRYLVIAWPAFWWKEHYAAWMRFIDARYPRLHDDENLVVFDLGSGETQCTPAAS